MPELIEFSWNEETEIAEFIYEHNGSFLTRDCRYHPLQVTPDRDRYFEELKIYLQTQQDWN